MSKSPHTSGVVPRAYSIEAFGKVVGLSKASVKRLIQHKDIHAVKIGARVLIPVEEVDRLLQRAESETVPLRGEPPPKRGPRVRARTPEMSAHIAALATKRRAKAKAKAEAKAEGR